MAQVRVRTRAQAALAMASATSPEPSPKRRKLNNNNDNTSQHLKLSESSLVQFTSSSDGAKNDVVTPETEERCSSPISDEYSPASCCSSNRSFELDQDTSKFLDLEVHSAQVETSTCNEIRREMSMSYEYGTNSQDVESTQKSKSCCALSKLQKMPTESELEQFFAAAEKDLQKQFSDKYNYDFVNDVPLEGRYEWVQLNP